MLEIRFATEEDKGQILAVIRQVLGEEQAALAERRWLWQWHQDPRSERPGSFGVVTVWQGQVIGSMSGIPMGLYVDGKPYSAHWHTDNCVHWGNLRRALRALKETGKTASQLYPKGISAAMVEFAGVERGQGGKHNTDAANSVLLNMGCQPLADSASWSRILGFRQPLEAYLGRLGAALIGGLADLFLPAIPKAKIPVCPMEGDFDLRFDELWELARQTYPAITRRDRATLNWRYRQHPDIRYSVLIAEAEGKLLGYLVYSSFFRHQQQRAQIVDLLCGLSDTATRQSLLAEALRRLKSAGVHKVECYSTHPALNEDLKKLKFKARIRKGRGQETLIRHLPDRPYYFTRGDGDGG